MTPTALALAAMLVATLPAPIRAETPAERGKYLTQHVAMCVQCHTPRREDGSLDEARLFQGAPVPFDRAPFPGTAWASMAPSIAGLPGFSDEDEITLLTTGHRPSGRTPQPPMPPFRLRREDAAAIVAYLRQLPARTP